MTTKYLVGAFSVCLICTAGATRTYAQAKPTAPKTAAKPVAKAKPAAPAFDYSKKAVAHLTEVGDRLVELAKAMPADKFAWHPEGKDLPPLSELYLMAATEYYHAPALLGAIRAETYETGESPDSTRKPIPRTIPFEKGLTEKGDVTNELFDAVSYFKGAMESLNDIDFQKTAKIQGRDATPNDVLFDMVNDTEEYLGQAMNYARLNGVVLPWMTELEQERHKRGLRDASQPK
jgi:hypothetical protein